MLHEILLSLSGHPSTLFDTKSSTSKTDEEIDFPLLSPPEQALLRTIGRLAHLHRNLRDHAARISSLHPSTICRAVATAITNVQLARFQRKILEVEAKILRRDAGTVGAYNIVPLAGVVGEFDEWTRRFEWFWQLVCFIQPPSKSKDTSCSGAMLIDRLRQEAQTGYPDIEAVALELCKTAETAWLRQLSPWVLYGRLPVVGPHDFFIRQNDDEAESVSHLLPKFVSSETAASILFIGKSLNIIRQRRTFHERGHVVSETELVQQHLLQLTRLALPLSSSALSNGISAIRLSLSRNTLQQLLPLPAIVQILSMLRDFFLLRHGSFAVSLVHEAETHLRARSKGTISESADGVKGLLFKDVELTTILTKTLTTLSSNIEDDHDTSLDFARSMLRLEPSKPTSTRPSTPGRARTTKDLPQLATTSFHDFLLPSPISLGMDIRPPFDLFITQAELSIYASLQSYLLSLRRAHLRFSSLWRQTSLRRSQPSPLAPPGSCKPYAAKAFSKRRQRVSTRNLEMRPVWATCTAAVFLLGEMSNYFEGEVIDEAWRHLHEWTTQKSPTRPSSSSRSRPSTSHSRLKSSQDEMSQLHTSINNLDLQSQDHPAPAPHDPAVLTAAHRLFLTSLSHSLLLTDNMCSATLHTLLRNMDILYSLIIRLQSIQENLDLEEDEGVVDPLASFAKDEVDVKRDLSRARKRVDAGLRDVISRLRAIDTEGGHDRHGLDGLSEATTVMSSESGRNSFVPWRAAGLERLLLRLEGGRKVGEAGSDDDDDAAFRR